MQRSLFGVGGEDGSEPERPGAMRRLPLIGVNPDVSVTFILRFKMMRPR